MSQATGEGCSSPACPPSEGQAPFFPLWAEGCHVLRSCVIRESWGAGAPWAGQVLGPLGANQVTCFGITESWLGIFGAFSLSLFVLSHQELGHWLQLKRNLQPDPVGSGPQCNFHPLGDQIHPAPPRHTHTHTHAQSISLGLIRILTKATKAVFISQSYQQSPHYRAEPGTTAGWSPKVRMVGRVWNTPGTQ